jgi:hypothetical protein
MRSKNIKGKDIRHSACNNNEVLNSKAGGGWLPTVEPYGKMTMLKAF